MSAPAGPTLAARSAAEVVDAVTTIAVATHISRNAHAQSPVWPDLSKGIRANLEGRVDNEFEGVSFFSPAP